MIVELLEDYGPFKKNDQKPVIESGSDWFLISARGTTYYIGKRFCRVLSH
jgi:hypothetical protein